MHFIPQQHSSLDNPHDRLITNISASSKLEMKPIDFFLFAQRPDVTYKVVGGKSSSGGHISAVCKFGRDSGSLARSQIILSFTVPYNSKGSLVVNNHQCDVRFDWLATKTIECSQVHSYSTAALSSTFGIERSEDFWLLELEYSVSDLMSTDMIASAELDKHQAIDKALLEYIFPVNSTGKLNTIALYLNCKDPKDQIDGIWNDWQAGWQCNPEVKWKSSVDTLRPEGKSQGHIPPVDISCLLC